MITFVPSAEWPLDATAIDWLTNYWFPTRLREAAECVRYVTSENGLPFPADCFQSLNARVEVFLHVSSFLDEFGRGDLGIYRPNSNLPATQIDSISPKGFNTQTQLQERIEIDWSTDYSSDGHVLRHEFGHMLCRHTFMTGWEYFGHGVMVNGVSVDPYIYFLSNRLNKLYPRNHPVFTEAIKTLSR